MSKHFTLRIPDKVAYDLDREASAADLTMAAYIVQVLTKHLDAVDAYHSGEGKRPATYIRVDEIVSRRT